MFIAADGNGKKIFIEDIDSRDKYFCPFCLQELDVRWGNQRRHYFAHKRKSSPCTDSWVNKNGYYDDDTNSWHYEWQKLFPAENQEVRLEFGKIVHRADVVVGNTVIEFQHSPLSHNKFEERTNYYHSCDCKVIWIFDLIDDFNNNEISFIDQKMLFWSNRKRTFDYFDSVAGDIELFFQLKDDFNQKSIVRVSEITGKNHDTYTISDWFTKNEFLAYLGCEEGLFPAPDLTKIDQDPKYIEFSSKYNVELDEQQTRALQRVGGNSLIVAVPGSGKTTTLINRLGYMINYKNVSPDEVLAITYTKKAAREMRKRFSAKFGEEVGSRIDFRTINSICDEIVRKEYGNISLVDEKEQRKILTPIYKKHNDDYPVEIDYLNMSAEISYVKNTLLSKEEVLSTDWNTDNFSDIYNDYCTELKNNKKYDFDDQMIIAFNVLKNNPQLLAEYRSRYKYINVDEAQDTSRIQHHFIKLLSVNSKDLFMVGDEDQSIYGYRGAFPKALLNFKHEYKNPFILRLENNYRSNKEIVDLAKSFIDRNPNRIQKNMKSVRGEGGTVQIINVDKRLDQFTFLVEEFKKEIGESVAVLYRNNDSAIPLIDLFDRNGIDFSLNKANNTFFSNRIVTDIKTFLQFSKDLDNKTLFLNTYNKFKLYFKKQQAEFACGYSSRRKTNLLDEFMEQSKYGKRHIVPNFERFIRTFRNLSSNPYEAIDRLLDLGYEEYVAEKGYGTEKIELIQMIAKNEETIESFLARIDYLEQLVKSKINSKEPDKEGVVLSTIHSSKGMEFDSVYVIDVIDTILPSRKSIVLKLEEKFGEYEEERRLLYVAVTRAKNKLTLFDVKQEETEFIKEIKSKNKDIPCVYKIKKKESTEKQLVNEQKETTKSAMLPSFLNFVKTEKEHPDSFEEILKLRKTEERKSQIDQKKKENLDEIRKKAESEIDKFIDEPYIDDFGKKWYKCLVCGKVARENEFSMYGGPHQVARGTCYGCIKKE